MFLQTPTKIFLSVIFVTFLCIPLFFFTIERAHAVWGIGDLPVDVPNAGITAGGTASEAGSLATGLEDAVKEFGLDTAAYMVGQKLSDMLVSKSVDWINSGFEGNPFYVEDTKSFMKEFEDVEILKLYSTIDTIDYGEGFSTGDFGSFSLGDKNTIVSLLNDAKKPIEEKLKPTLTDIERENFSNDFTQGGWDAWEKLAEPQNNPFGREDIIKQEYSKNVTEAKDAAIQEAQRVNFQDQKECVQPSSTNVFGNNDWNSFGFDVNESYFNANNDPNCERQETTTPGSVASKTAEEASVSQFSALPMMDEFSEIASSALGTMFNALISKGFSELTSSGTSESPSVSGIQYLGTEVTSGTGSDGTVDWLNSPTQSVDLEIELPEAIRLAGTATAYLAETVEAQKEYLPLVMDLDYLLPGPDLGWQERLQKYWTSHSQDEQMWLARKDIDTDPRKARYNHFEGLKREIVLAMEREQEWLDDASMRVLPLSLDNGMRGYIGDLAGLGRQATRAKDDLTKMRNLYLRLVGIKEEIMGTGYNTGAYNPNTDSWEGATGFTPEQWDAWRTEGIIDGVPQTNPDGTPIEVVRAREELLNIFLGMQRELPKASSLTGYRNQRNSTLFTVKDMKRLIAEAEAFWAQNYRIGQNGQTYYEDYPYWNTLYSWFVQYDAGNGTVNLGTTNLGVERECCQPDPWQLGGPWQVSGTWPQHLVIPTNWADIIPNNFQTNNVLSSLLPNERAVVNTLRAIENQEKNSTSERKFYSIPIEKPWLWTRFQAPWNVLRRDRENRLFCGFQFYPGYNLSSELGSGDSRPKNYSRMWCTETRAAEKSGEGFYRASSFDYSKVYRPDLAGVLLGM